MIPEEDIEVRLARLEHERLIRRRLQTYCRTLDDGDADGWVDCFDPAAVLEVQSEPRTARGNRIEGRTDLRLFIERVFQAPLDGYRHFTLMPEIDLQSEATAEAVSYFMVLLSSKKEPVVRSFGRYIDHLACSQDGVWRFTHRLIEVDALRSGDAPLAGWAS